MSAITIQAAEAAAPATLAGMVRSCLLWLKNHLVASVSSMKGSSMRLGEPFYWDDYSSGTA
jgi:hypothetical protein